MRTPTRQQAEESLRNYETSESDPLDDIFWYMSTFDFTDWCDAATETMRVANEIFGLEVEEYSKIHALIEGAASAGFDAALRGMSNALGFSADDIEYALHYHLWEGEKKPISIERFIELCHEGTKFHAELKAGKFDNDLPKE